MKLNKVLVFGSINIDHHIKIKKQPKIGETIIDSVSKITLGGKGANQAVAASLICNSCYFIGYCGVNDKQMILNELHKYNCNSNIQTVDESSGIAYIHLLPNGDNYIIVSPNANLKWDAKIIENNEIINNIKCNDIILLQMEIPLYVNIKICKISKKINSKIKIILDAGGIDENIKIDELNCLLNNIDVLSLNEIELDIIYKILNKNNKSNDDYLTMMEKINNKYNIPVLGHFGSEGSIWIDKNIKIKNKIHVDENDIVSTVGAGDCFIASFASFYEKNDINKCLQLSNIAASLSIKKDGTMSSYPKYDELIN